MKISFMQALPVQLGILWDKLRSALWLVPLLMLITAIALFQVAQSIDAGPMAKRLAGTWWLHRGTGGDARNLMATLVAAIITMSSVVFSITIVTLTLAASQFGSRLVRTYFRDWRSRVALGMFLMTTVYCLLALRVLTETMSPAQVPHVTVTLGLALGMLCVAMLLFFLSVTATSIVADEVVRRVAEELDVSIECLPPHRPEADNAHARPASSSDAPPRGGSLLRSEREGYIQAIRYEDIAQLAARHDLEVQLHAKPGDYLARGGWIGFARPAENCTSTVLEAVQGAVLIGSVRTPVQDLRFSIRHLVDVALRALSPAINDANTAMIVIDRLRGSMARLMEKSLPDGVFRDATGRLRLVARRQSHAQILDAAFYQIRNAAAPQPAVVIALLEAFERLAEHVLDAEQGKAVVEQATLAAEAGLQHAAQQAERTAITRLLAAVRDKVEFVETTPRVRQLPEGDPLPHEAAV